jgi:hypothetical protein
MSPIEFRPANQGLLLGWLIAGGLLFLGPGIALLIVRPTAILIVFCCCGLMIGLGALDSLTARTVLDDSGVRTGTLFRHRSRRWDQIAKVETWRFRNLRGRTLYTVRLRLNSGRKFRLVLPRHGTNEPDPAFNDKVRQISDRLAAQRSRLGC